MKIYRVGVQTNLHGNRGYQYFSSMKKATMRMQELRSTINQDSDETILEVYKYPISKIGFLDALNQLGSHPDNG